MQRQIDDHTFVDGQISPADIIQLKALGITMIINNRPDGEDEGQPTSDEIEAAARAEGLDYRHVPIARGMGPSDIEAMREAMNAAKGGKLMAYCRSGNRSILAWAVASNEEGTPTEELRRCAEGAGFSLDPVAHLLRD